MYPYSLFLHVPLTSQMPALLDGTLTLASNLAPDVQNISTNLQQA